MSWVWWLSAPVLATALAAMWSWLRSRPARVPTTSESVAAHRDYLDALVRTARSHERGPVPADRARPADYPASRDD